MSIICDTNEPEKFRREADATDNLPVDYYVVGEFANFAIERKELPDLNASLTDTRLWEQVDSLRQLKTLGYTPFVVTIGSLYYYMTSPRAMTPAQYRGTQIAIAKSGVSYMHVDTVKDFFELLQQLKVKAGTKKEYIRPTIHKPERTMAQERQDMISAIKGIGGKTAKEIVSYAVTVDNLCRLIKDNDPTLLKMLNKPARQHAKDILLGAQPKGLI